MKQRCEHGKLFSGYCSKCEDTNRKQIESTMSPYGYYCKLCGKIHFRDCIPPKPWPDQPGSSALSKLT